LRPSLDVASQLFKRLGPDPASTEIALHLDHGRTHRDIYSASITEGRLEVDVLDVPLVKLEGRRQDELAHVCLYVCFRSRSIATGKRESSSSKAAVPGIQ